MGSPDSSKRGAYAAPASASKPRPNLDFLFFFQRILILSWESCSESCEPGCHHCLGDTFRYSRLLRSRHASRQFRPHIRTHFGATTMFKARLISTWAPQGLKRQFSNLFNDLRHLPPLAHGVLGSRTTATTRRCRTSRRSSRRQNAPLILPRRTSGWPIGRCGVF